MDEKIRFIARLIEGEKMNVLCREFGISRKTGYKIKQRYEDIGISGIGDQSRRPLRLSNQLPFQIEKVIVKMKQERPYWGAAKLRELLIRKYPQMKVPAKSTVHAVLDRYGLVKKRRRKRYKACGTVLGTNHQSPIGLSRLSVWWLRLGIGIERIRPGHPEQNGRHERLHLTLKKEATKPAGMNILQQQEKFDRFIREYNEERPHQALNMRCPKELYKRSRREYGCVKDLEYPLHDRVVRVTYCGRICIGKRKISLSRVFAGQDVGIREVDDKIWQVSFMEYDLGFFDEQTGKVEPGENPFGVKV